MTAIDPVEVLEIEWEFRKRLRKRIDARIDKAYPIGGEAEYRATIELMGNPPDQIANFEAAGVILQPKQLEFAAWARRADDPLLMPPMDEEGELLGVPEIGMGGAKGGGKSLALFAQIALDDCMRFPGLKVLYLRKAGNKAREQIQDLIGSTLPLVPYDFVIGEIRFPNGSRIIAGHFQTEKEALNYAGIEYDIVVIEETTQLSLYAYKSLRLAARSSKQWADGRDWRPRVYNSTNPLGIGHSWYKKRFIVPMRERERAGIDKLAPSQRVFIPATVHNNYFVNVEYVGSLEDLTGAEKKAYLEGDWDVAAGAYFENFVRRLVVVLPFEDISWMEEVWASMDYGFKHWNIVYLHGRGGDGMLYTFDEMARRLYTVEDLIPEIKEFLAKYGLKREHLSRFLVGADAFNETGHSRDTIAVQYSRGGLQMSRANTAPGSRVKRAHFILKLLGNPERKIPPTWKITENCPILIEQLGTLERNPNNPEDVLKVDVDEAGNGGDDGYDAASYGLYLVGRGTVAFSGGSS